MKKKIITTIIIGLIACIFFGFIMAAMVYANMEDPLPTPLFIFILVICMIPIFGIVVNVIERIKEIKGGEEDEASKY